VRLKTSNEFWVTMELGHINGSKEASPLYSLHPQGSILIPAFYTFDTLESSFAVIFTAALAPEHHSPDAELRLNPDELRCFEEGLWMRLAMRHILQQHQRIHLSLKVTE